MSWCLIIQCIFIPWADLSEEIRWIFGKKWKKKCFFPIFSNFQKISGLNFQSGGKKDFVAKLGFKCWVCAQVGENWPTRTVFMHFQKIPMFENVWKCLKIQHNVNIKLSLFFAQNPHKMVKFDEKLNFCHKNYVKIHFSKKFLGLLICTQKTQTVDP